MLLLSFSTVFSTALDKRLARRGVAGSPCPLEWEQEIDMAGLWRVAG